MAEDDKLPRYSYDLITLLAEEIGSPTFPNTANGFAGLTEDVLRRAAFTAGARSVVEHLLTWRDEEEEAERDGDTEGASDGLHDRPEVRFPRVFGSDGEVREVTSPVTLAEDAS